MKLSGCKGLKHLYFRFRSFSARTIILCIDCHRFNNGDDRAVGVSVGEVCHDFWFVSNRQLTVVTVLVTPQRRAVCLCV
jgi:hypothetical protein